MLKEMFHKVLREILSTRAGFHLAGRMVTSLGWHLGQISAEMLAKVAGDGTVQAGPFKGLRYPQLTASGSQLPPKLIGAYEFELQPVLEQALQRNPDLVVNIGCGEGYYAVGSALRLPGARVLAYDLDPLALANCKAMAWHNEVADRLELVAGCTPEKLRGLPFARAMLVLCDCEGAELELLQPEYFAAPADFLVELHRVEGRDPEQEITARFAPTHDVTVIKQAARDPADWPVLAKLTGLEQQLALSEMRAYPMTWLYLRCKAVPAAATK